MNHKEFNKLKSYVENNEIDELKNFVYKNGSSDLHIYKDYLITAAVYYGHVGVVKFLIKEGLNINALKGKALRDACFNGDVEMVKFLLSLKDININNKERNALHTAVTHRKLKVAELLLNDKRLQVDENIVTRLFNVVVDRNDAKMFELLINNTKILKIILAADFKQLRIATKYALLLRYNLKTITELEKMFKFIE